MPWLGLGPALALGGGTLAACCMDVIQQLNKVSCSLSALTPSLAATWRPRRAATASPLDLRRVETEEKPSSSILGDLGQ